MGLFFTRKKNFYPKSRSIRERLAKRNDRGALSKKTSDSHLNFLSRWASYINWEKVRINGIISLFCLLWIILWARAWQLQMIEGPSLADRAKRQHLATELVSGKRGIIYDRNGQVLARSVEALSVYAKPNEISDIKKVVSFLSPVLEINPEKLHADLINSKRKFIWLKRKIDDYTATTIKKANLSGIGLSKEFERFYPFKHMAGQLLGFVGMDDKGLEGLEKSLDGVLCAPSVRQVVQRDARGRKFYQTEIGQSEPVGEDVTLTLDMHIQFVAEEEIAKAVKEYDAKWGGAIVVEVETGDIIAWAQYPFFNPNLYRNVSPEVFRNRLAADALEPGSTFKPLVMAVALQENKLNPNTLINCEGGKWEKNKLTIRDTSIQGILPASKVIRYSSNIGMAKIGQELGPRLFHTYLSKLGFGEQNPLPIYNSKGILRKPKDWGEMDVMATAFGQSISVTGLQMAQAYLTFLNHGIYKPLRLVSEDNNVQEQPIRIFSDRCVLAVKNMMKDVVEASDGTGRRARVEGIVVGGKTGTAQKADKRTKRYGQEHLASFVGFLPADDPKYLILVFVDEPAKNQFGGIVAAPVFRDIAKRVLTQSGALDKKIVAEKNLKSQKKERGLKLASAPAQPWTKSKTIIPASAEDSLKFPGYLSRASADVPNVTGKSVRSAVELFARAGVVPEIKGAGRKVIKQMPAPGVPWSSIGKEGTCILWVSES